MNNFKRSGNSKESLNIGTEVKYKKMWEDEMQNNWESLSDWAIQKGINHSYGIMNFPEGTYDFYIIEFDQKPKYVCSFALEYLIKELSTGITDDENLVEMLDQIF